MRKIFAFSMAMLLIFAMCIGTVSAKPNQQRNNVANVFEGDSIQEAIDSAIDGAHIFVHEGTYVERLVIDGKDLKLTAVGEVVIEEPNPSEAVSLRIDTIFVSNSICTIEGFIIDVNDGWTGIVARGETEELIMTVKNNEVIDYERNGITVLGEYATGYVKDNLVTGQIDSFWANNGIQFGSGACGVIDGNTVKDNYWIGSGWTASGILLNYSSDVQVTDNILDGCQSSIYAVGNDNTIMRNTVTHTDWAILAIGDNNKVMNNAIEDGYVGVYTVGAGNKVVKNTVEDVDYGIYSTGDDNLIVNNFLENGSYGVIMVGDDNKIINNKIIGYEFEEEYNEPYIEGVENKLHANKII